MPFISAVPAPVPYWVQECYWPSLIETDTTNSGLNKNKWAYRGFLNDPTSSGPMVVSGPAGAAGGSVARLENVNGLPMILRYSSPGVQQDVWRFPLLPGALNPGATAGNLITREDWRVCWWRIPFMDVGGIGGTDTAQVWSFDVGNPPGVSWAPSGSAVQQLGIFSDTAGGIQYRSYSSAPALLQTTPITGYTTGQWNVFDHVFVSGAPGRIAQYNFYLNGTLKIARDFGTAVLPYVTAPRLQFITSVDTATTYYAYFWGRGGKFGPDGREYLS